MPKQFKTEDFGMVEVIERIYGNGRTAILLVSAENGQPVCTLTVNLPEKALQEGEFFVRVSEENADIAEEARESGLFEDTGRRVTTGFIQAEVWKYSASQRLCWGCGLDYLSFWEDGDLSWTETTKDGKCEWVCPDCIEEMCERGE
jgi:hypothetical protein